MKYEFVRKARSLNQSLSCLWMGCSLNEQVFTHLLQTL